jgi:hypothetical protein
MRFFMLIFQQDIKIALNWTHILADFTKLLTKNQENF